MRVFYFCSGILICDFSVPSCWHISFMYPCISTSKLNICRFVIKIYIPFFENVAWTNCLITQAWVWFSMNKYVIHFIKSYLWFIKIFWNLKIFVNFFLKNKVFVCRSEWKWNHLLRFLKPLFSLNFEVILKLILT